MFMENSTHPLVQLGTVVIETGMPDDALNIKLGLGSLVNRDALGNVAFATGTSASVTFVHGAQQVRFDMMHGVIFFLWLFSSVFLYKMYLFLSNIHVSCFI